VSRHQTLDLPLLPAVAAGGAVGALLRWQLSLAWSPDLPWVTLGINAAGAFLLGVLHAAGRGYLRVPRWARAFVGPGLLAGFTTFSAYALETQELLSSGQVVAGLGYAVATPLCCLLAVEIALRLLPDGRR
jgi:fluoride exporter